MIQIKCTEQSFPVVLFNLHNMVPGSVDEILSVTNTWPRGFVFLQICTLGNINVFNKLLLSLQGHYQLGHRAVKFCGRRRGKRTQSILMFIQ